jgi:hypothetical protein
MKALPQEWEIREVALARGKCRGRTPVIDTVEAAGVASKAARLWPLLSIEG